MRERDVVKDIRDELGRRGAFAMKYHGTVYGVAGHSDLYGVLPGGRAFFLEVKRPGGRTSKVRLARQKAFRDRAAAAGALTGSAASVAEAVDILGLTEPAG